MEMNSLYSRAEIKPTIIALILSIYLTSMIYLILPHLGEGIIPTIFDNTISRIIIYIFLWAIFLQLFIFYDTKIETAYFKDIRSLSLKTLANTNGCGLQESSLVNQIVITALKGELTQNSLKQQQEEHLTRMELSFSLLNTLIWVLPTLGFLGTVIGIANSIGGFSSFIDNNAMTDIAMLRIQIGHIIGGLSIAFNTTLLGLLAVIPVKFINVLLYKKKTELILDVYEYIRKELNEEDKNK